MMNALPGTLCCDHLFDAEQIAEQIVTKLTDFLRKNVGKNQSVGKMIYNVISDTFGVCLEVRYVWYRVSLLPT